MHSRNRRRQRVRTDPARFPGLLPLIFKLPSPISATYQHYHRSSCAPTTMVRAVRSRCLHLASGKSTGAPGRGMKSLVGCALAGTLPFFCDSMSPPAISVLSAVEGSELMKPYLEHVVLPLTLGVLAISVRRCPARHGAHGEAVRADLVLWFVSLGGNGRRVFGISRLPQVLVAVNPLRGVDPDHASARGAGDHRRSVSRGDRCRSAVCGHGALRQECRCASPGSPSFLPSLLLNYYGQGALFLAAGDVVPRPLYTMVPTAVLPFMIVLATAATVIASQAVISGAFSVARQAVQLDLLPRLRILQTSAEAQGQIYVPSVNGLLFVAVVAFVVGFKNPDALSAAYGAAVIGTMAMTTVLGSYVAMTQWNWPKPFVCAAVRRAAADRLLFHRRQPDESG